MGITQDSMTSTVETPLFRGLAARRNPFPAKLMTDFSPQRLVSMVFVKAREV